MFTNSISLTEPAADGICTICAHKDICVYQGRCDAAQAAVNKLLFEADWANPVIISCKHYMRAPGAVEKTEGEA